MLTGGTLSTSTEEPVWKIKTRKHKKWNWNPNNAHRFCFQWTFFHPLLSVLERFRHLFNPWLWTVMKCWSYCSLSQYYLFLSRSQVKHLPTKSACTLLVFFVFPRFAEARSSLCRNKQERAVLTPPLQPLPPQTLLSISLRCIKGLGSYLCSGMLQKCVALTTLCVTVN